MNHHTPYKRSFWFAMLLVALIITAAVTATMMITHTAERSMHTQVERKLNMHANDGVAELMVWYAGLRGQMNRLASTDVFRLYAAESTRVGAHQDDSAFGAREESANLAARLPFMRKMLQNFVNYTGFESARILNADMQAILGTGDASALPPLSPEQLKAAQQALQSGDFTAASVRSTPQGLVLDLFQPIYAPEYVEGDAGGVKQSVAVLMTSRNITDRLDEVEKDARQDEGGAAHLMLRDNTTIHDMRPDGMLLDTADWTLEEGELPLALRALPENGKMVYSLGVPVRGLPWLLVQSQEQDKAEAEFVRRRQTIQLVAIVATAVLLILLSIIWWLVVGRRDKAFTSEMHKLYETVNVQNQLLVSLDNALPVGIVLCDEHGRIRHVNIGFAAMLDHSPASLPGLALTPLLPAKLAEHVQESMEQVLEHGSTVTFAQKVALPGWKEDKGRVCQVMCSPYLDQDERRSGTVCVVQHFSDEVAACMFPEDNGPETPYYT